MTRLTRQHLFLIIALNLLLSIPSLWVPYYKVDELTNAIFARFLNSGLLTLKDFLGNPHLLTHYLYALIFRFTESNTLLPVHIVHALWKSLTIIALYDTGKQLHNEKTGLWSALFYCVYSYCFMSKDFHTPSSESWSLLPATIAVGFFFRALASERAAYYFLAGLFAGIATLFKMPMGVTIVAITIILLFHWSRFVRNAAMVNSGFFLCLSFPALFVMPVGSGFSVMAEKLLGSTTTYIAFYESSLLYWGSKFLLRSALVGLSVFAMTLFVCHGIRNLFLVRAGRERYWQKLLFLVLWLGSLWLTATLGKRIFFYYFMFLMAPMALIAATSVVDFDARVAISAAEARTRIFKFISFVRRHIALIMAVPLIGFSIEGASNYSTLAVMPSDFKTAARMIAERTRPSDRIYVWGYIPQLYFYSGRLPASTYIWSDVLAGSYPGSSAMEYLHATGKTLTLDQQLLKDFDPIPFERKPHRGLNRRSALATVTESELFTYQELLNRIENPRWHKVFSDFFAHPPELIIDSSPLNYRGFGYYPIANYELLKRFVVDNYHLEGVVEEMLVYRLNH